MNFLQIGIVGNTMKSIPRIVIDTNVLVFAVRTGLGWSLD